MDDGLNSNVLLRSNFICISVIKNFAKLISPEFGYLPPMEQNNSDESSSNNVVTLSLMGADEGTPSSPSAFDSCISLPLKLVSRDDSQITYVLAPVNMYPMNSGGSQAEHNGNIVLPNESHAEQESAENMAEGSTEDSFEVTTRCNPFEEQQLTPSVSSPSAPISSKCTIVVKRDSKRGSKSARMSEVRNDPASAAPVSLLHADGSLDAEMKTAKTVKRKRRIADWLAEGIDPTKLEESVDQVRARFEKGCECDGDTNCFEGINPEFVYKHRLNIAELTRAEHDMYLMGVTMATAANPEGSLKNAKRQRLKTSYIFLGKEVCLDAWLYLENCTLHQLKSVRKHLMTHGVSPRVHGNHGKKPHNAFPLQSYQMAFNFLENWFRSYLKETSNDTDNRRSGGKQKAAVIYLPPELTRKRLHLEYKKYFETQMKDEQGKDEDGLKVMGYCTFSQFLKVQFPHVRFAKVELNNAKAISQQANKSKSSKSDRSLIFIQDSNNVNQFDSNILPGQGYVVSVPLDCEFPKDDGSIVYLTTTSE